MEPGKLFIGGISWDTNEDRLREYFQNFGDVVEAVIMKDRTTGRARGFGFVIYADPAVAERVVKQKHMLDGRTVEAKKAVPRDDQHIPSKNNSSILGSPGPARTKKIFVGGLPSTVTESDFKRYFDQFGLITDVVVMYDHNTQRPRGFGFITYDSEEAVERALVRNFHELNGKMVEVKRAVPKEFSPGPTRSQLSGHNYCISTVSSLLNGTQGYSPSIVGGYGIRMDDRHIPVSVGRSAFPSFTSSSFGTTLNSEPRMNGEPANFILNFSHERGSNALYRRGSFPEYDGTSEGNGSTSVSTHWTLWGKGSNSNAAYNQNSSSFVGFKNADIVPHSFNGTEAIWGSSAVLGQAVGSDSFYTGRNLSYGSADVSVASRAAGYGNHGAGMPTALSDTALNGDHEANIGELHGSNDDISWLPSSLEFNGSGPFEFGLGNATSDVLHKNPALCW
ncbi:hypothetical protein Ancab_033383 [Ancistrocladus abbreviatus]